MTAQAQRLAETQVTCREQTEKLVCMGDLDRWQGNLTEEECRPSSNPLPTAIDVGIEGWDKAELRTGELICQIQPTVVSENQRKAVIQYVQHLLRRCFGCEVFAFGSVPLKTYLSDGDIDLTAFSQHKQLTNVWGNQVRSALKEEERRQDAEFRVKDVQYIDAAEVKLVKCLVENIVVDISFNQLGGLGTLCFLEEVNLLIGKKHLFKRSIILVKAWCYYESRILGAHHGLISTYALETLVLYIFHLFHASLRGPLEVLFRFLDYFSKFDWDNYCVSIQGPVPKVALPQITAEPPQTDGGKLLLSKEFLKKCIDKYSDVPNGHDSNSRQFISKFLNVVDPLRENNNLGRSVSKANFYRIRSAFGYGARKLAKVLQSPEGKISAELDHFFPITWERHASVQRPDVPDSISLGLECKFSVENASFMASSESIVENDKQDTKENASTEGNGSQYGETVGRTSNLKSETIKTDKSLIPTSAGDMAVMAQSNCTDLNIVQTKSIDASLMNLGEMGSWEDGFREKDISDNNNIKLVRHDNLYNVVSDENVTFGDDRVSFTSAPSFKEQESELGSSVVQANLSPDYPSQNIGTPFLSPKSNGAVFAGYDPPFQAIYRAPVAMVLPSHSGKQTSSFSVGVSAGTNISKPLTSQVNDISALSSNPSHLPRGTESTGSNPYAYHPNGIPFPLIDTYKSMYPVQPSVEVGGASYKSQGKIFESANEVIRKKSLKDQQASKNAETGPMQNIEIVIPASFPNPRLESMPIGAVVNGLSSPRSDFLGGDFESHLRNLDYGRSCQNHVWQGSVAQYQVPPQYTQEYHLWEGPGRPVHPNMSMPSNIHGQGVVPRHPYFQVVYQGVNSPVLPGTFNVEEMRRPRSGTGTYLPNLSYHSYRGKIFPKGKHQNGTPAHDSTAREGGAHHSSSRNQVRYNSGSSWQTGYSNIDGKFGTADLSRKERLCKSSYPSNSHAVMGNIAIASQPGSVAPGLQSLSHVSGQEAPSFTAVGPSGPPFVTLSPFSNGTSSPSDPLQFGTFGPLQFSNHVRSESGGYVMSVLNEQSYKSGAAAPLPSSSERGLQQPAAPSKQERALLQSYQMKEEDFPPLSFQGKHKGSSATAGNGHSCNGRSSPS